MIGIFAGKGGVGKTTCAAASALHYASLGQRTMAISTDATPSLSHIFEVTTGAKPAAVRQSLDINELGLDQVRGLWDRKFGKEVYDVFSTFVSIDYPDFLEFMTSLLPGLAEEFMIDYIRDLSNARNYDTIIWDTAPLGQTLALLRTPAMLAEHLRMAPRVYSKLRRGQQRKESVMDIIKRWRDLSEASVDFLRTQVEFTVITIPEALAVEQLGGVFAELNKFNFVVKQLVINNVVTSPDSNFLRTKASEQEKYIKFLREKFGDLRIVEVPMFPHEIKGMDRIREVERVLFQ
ncbi:MAG: ArsA family ATPase [Nitrososphaerota archaeon]|nr:ArsA family ATPase [Nitrososphaerota archaeon]